MNARLPRRPCCLERNCAPPTPTVPIRARLLVPRPDCCFERNHAPPTHTPRHSEEKKKFKLNHNRPSRNDMLIIFSQPTSQSHQPPTTHANGALRLKKKKLSPHHHIESPLHLPQDPSHRLAPPPPHYTSARAHAHAHARRTTTTTMPPSHLVLSDFVPPHETTTTASCPHLVRGHTRARAHARWMMTTATPPSPRPQPLRPSTRDDSDGVSPSLCPQPPCPSTRDNNNNVSPSPPRQPPRPSTRDDDDGNGICNDNDADDDEC